MPVAAVTAARQTGHQGGVERRHRGTRRVSAITSFLPVFGSDTTAATVTSDPVPAVVGTA